MDILQQVVCDKYVYQIRDVDTQEIVYVGKGAGERAWKSNRYGQPKLSAYLQALGLRGYSPDQYTEVVARGLCNDDAKKIEAELIAELRPKYNGVSGKVSLSVEQVKIAQELRSQGLSYAKVAEKMDASPMAVYRALSGRSAGYLKLMREVA